MGELEALNKEQINYKYITPEIITLQGLLEKAKHWQSKVEEIRDKVVHVRNLDAIYQDSKNIPVNFEGLMVEL